MFKNLVFFCCLLLVFESCEKEKSTDSDEFLFQSGQTIWVLNEGNFQSGNASVSVINRTTGEVIQNITERVNGVPLGDVLQSALMVNEKVWLTVNNSGKIVVVNPTNFKIEKTIEGIGSPRFLHQIGDEVFVSDFQTQTLHIFNALSFQKVAEIYTGSWSEQMAWVGNELWLTMVNKNKIYCINPATRTITDSISTYDQPLNITTDALGKVWVLCGGHIFPRTAANLVSYDASSKTEITRFEFPNSPFKPSRLSKNPAGDTLFWIYDGVFAHGINSTNFPVSPIIAANGRNFYGLRYDAVTKHLWLSDAKNYVQQGEVFEVNQNGEVLRTFASGFIPGDFYFY